MCSDLAGCDSSDRRHLFWVPQTCREAVCGIETLAVFNKHATRLDLSQFIHGTSWARCYDPHASALVNPSYCASSTDNNSSWSPQYSSPTTDNPIPSCLSISKESPCLESDDRPSSETTPPSLPISARDHSTNSVRPAPDCPPAASDPPVSSYAHHFQSIAIILIPLISIYYFRTISSNK